MSLMKWDYFGSAALGIEADCQADCQPTFAVLFSFVFSYLVLDVGYDVFSRHKVCSLNVALSGVCKEAGRLWRKIAVDVFDADERDALSDDVRNKHSP